MGEKKREQRELVGEARVELQIFYSQILRVGQSSPQQPETPSDWLRKGEIKTTVNFWPRRNRERNAHHCSESELLPPPHPHPPPPPRPRCSPTDPLLLYPLPSILAFSLYISFLSGPFLLLSFPVSPSLALVLLSFSFTVSTPPPRLIHPPLASFNLQLSFSCVSFPPMNLCLAAYSLMRQSEGGRQAGREGGRNRAGKSWGKGIEREETAREGGWEQRQERERQ